MTSANSFDRAEGEIYEFRVRGELSPHWSEWFDGFDICASGGETVVRGPVRDEASLYGLIGKLRNLGLVLLSLNAQPSGQQSEYPGSGQ
jgi:hypothetical protein